jgi:apolipoprotein N-acyltransferase
VRQIHFSAWLLVGLSSLLQVLIFPLTGIYVLSWVAFAPLIVALLRARPAGALEVEGAVKLQPANPGQAFLLAYVSGILWYAGTCYWIYNTMREHGGLSVPAALLALFLFCLYLGLYHGLFGWLLSVAVGPDRDHRRALVAAPFLWVAVELARTRVTGFPWELLGTAQVDNPDGGLRSLFRNHAGECRGGCGFSGAQEKTQHVANRRVDGGCGASGGKAGGCSPAGGGSLRAAGSAKYSGR